MTEQPGVHSHARAARGNGVRERTVMVEHPAKDVIQACRTQTMSCSGLRRRWAMRAGALESREEDVFLSGVDKEQRGTASSGTIQMSPRGVTQGLWLTIWAAKKMAQLGARPVARISHIWGLALKRYVSTSERRAQGKDLCNKVAVRSSDLLHSRVEMQIDICLGWHHNPPHDARPCIGLGWISLEADGCFVAARLFSISAG